MGVCGVGKSTVAVRLAQHFNGSFVEADRFHPPENVEAMSAGIPLNDDMRWYWLESLCEHVRAESGGGSASVFVACSALKKKYRDFMRKRLGPLFIIHLDGDRELILRRLEARKDHFMPPALLDSQLGDLERPSANEAPGACFDVSQSVDRIIADISAMIEKEARRRGKQFLPAPSI
ncbi:gluconokinase [Rhizobiales bacterium]|nr:gluconokinase [Hongsoonwoonella zoysiae]NRG18280.1 gluconokinase [Hongsoonwoonella zoysiae]